MASTPDIMDDNKPPGGEAENSSTGKEKRKKEKGLGGTMASLNKLDFLLQKLHDSADRSRESSPDVTSKEQTRSGSSRRKPKVTQRILEDDHFDGDEEGDMVDSGASQPASVASPSVFGDAEPSPKPSTSQGEDSQGALGNETIDIDEDGNFILPEGTVVVEPEAVDDSKNYKGSELGKSRRSRGGASVAGAATERDLHIIHCTACNRQINHNVAGAVRRHPVLKVLICKKCYSWYTSAEIDQDSNGLDEQCRWCGDGGNLICCDFCHNAFCKACIKRNLGRAELSTILEADDDSKWRCYVCDPKALKNVMVQCDQIIETIERHQKMKQVEKERQKQATAVKTTPKQAAMPTARVGPASVKKVAGQKPGPASYKQQQMHRADDKVNRPKAGPASYKQRFMTRQNQPLTKSVLNSSNSPKPVQMIASARPPQPQSVQQRNAVYAISWDLAEIEISEHIVGAVLDKYIAVSQSMVMLLNTLKDELKQNVTSPGETAKKLKRTVIAFKKSYKSIDDYVKNDSKNRALKKRSIQTHGKVLQNGSTPVKAPAPVVAPATTTPAGPVIIKFPFAKKAKPNVTPTKPTPLANAVTKNSAHKKRDPKYDYDSDEVQVIEIDDSDDDDSGGPKRSKNKEGKTTSEKSQEKADREDSAEKQGHKPDDKKEDDGVMQVDVPTESRLDKAMNLEDGENQAKTKSVQAKADKVNQASEDEEERKESADDSNETSQEKKHSAVNVKSCADVDLKEEETVQVSQVKDRDEETSNVAKEETSRNVSDEETSNVAKEETLGIVSEEETSDVAKEETSDNVSDEETSNAAKEETSGNVSDEKTSNVAMEETSGNVSDKEMSNAAKEETLQNVSDEEISTVAKEQMSGNVELMSFARIKPLQDVSDDERKDDVLRCSDTAEQENADSEGDERSRCKRARYDDDDGLNESEHLNGGEDSKDTMQLDGHADVKSDSDVDCRGEAHTTTDDDTLHDNQTEGLTERCRMSPRSRREKTTRKKQRVPSGGEDDGDDDQVTDEDEEGDLQAWYSRKKNKAKRKEGSSNSLCNLLPENKRNVKICLQRLTSEQLIEACHTDSCQTGSKTRKIKVEKESEGPAVTDSKQSQSKTLSLISDDDEIRDSSYGKKKIKISLKRITSDEMKTSHRSESKKSRNIKNSSNNDDSDSKSNLDSEESHWKALSVKDDDSESIEYEKPKRKTSDSIKNRLSLRIKRESDSRTKQQDCDDGSGEGDDKTKVLKIKKNGSSKKSKDSSSGSSPDSPEGGEQEDTKDSIQRTRADLEAQRQLHKELLDSEEDDEEEKDEEDCTSDASESLGEEESSEEAISQKSSGEEFTLDKSSKKSARKRRPVKSSRAGTRQDYCKNSNIRKYKDKKHAKKSSKDSSDDDSSDEKSSRKKKLHKKSRSRSDSEESDTEHEVQSSRRKSKKSTKTSPPDTKSSHKRKSEKTRKEKSSRDSASSNFDSDLETEIEKLAKISANKSKKREESKNGSEKENDETHDKVKEVKEKKLGKMEDVDKKTKSEKRRELIDNLGSSASDSDEDEEKDEPSDVEEKVVQPDRQTEESDEDSKARKALLYDTDSDSQEQSDDSDDDGGVKSEKEKTDSSGKKGTDSKAENSDNKEEGAVSSDDDDGGKSKKKCPPKHGLLSGKLSDDDDQSYASSGDFQPKRRKRKDKSHDDDQDSEDFSVKKRKRKNSSEDGSGSSDSDFISSKKKKVPTATLR